MNSVENVSRRPRQLFRPLTACAIAAFAGCVLILIWAYVPLFSRTGSVTTGTLGWRVFAPLALIFLNVLTVLLTSSVIAAMFAQSSWSQSSSSRRVSFTFVAPLIVGVLLFATQATLIWRISIALAVAHRLDAVVWTLAEIAVSFLTTHLLLEPLLILPREVSDAAKVEGLGFAGSFRYVMLPRMKTRMLLASILPMATGFVYVLPSLTGN